MRIVDLQQNSADWLTWREQGLGASDAPVIWNGKHFDRTLLTLWQEKVGLVRRGKKKSSWAMDEGKRWEPLVLAWYEEAMEIQAPAVCALHSNLDWLRASLDGWTGVEPVEAKYARKEWHQQALDRVVPEEYRPQLWHQLLVTGARRVIYLSVNPRFSERQRFALVAYTPEPGDLDRLLAREIAFWQCVQSRMPPDVIEVP